MASYERALTSLFPDHAFVIEGEFDLDKVDWQGDVPDIDQAQLDAKYSELVREERIAQLSEEVNRRILLHASPNTQMNMTGAAIAGLLNDAQMQAYRDGLLWIAAMRQKGAELAQSDMADFKDDKHWPTPDPSAVALADAF